MIRCASILAMLAACATTRDELVVVDESGREALRTREIFGARGRYGLGTDIGALNIDGTRCVVFNDAAWGGHLSLYATDECRVVVEDARVCFDRVELVDTIAQANGADARLRLDGCATTKAAKRILDGGCITGDVIVGLDLPLTSAVAKLADAGAEQVCVSVEDAACRLVSLRA